MKLATVDNVIERSGDLPDEENFTIALTAKAIEVLSSQIYKDAQLAIVRELGTNAADSHIDAGKRGVPFDVTLPTALTPELVIRDYGTGMAYQKVMTMYRTYFGSDKTNSNEVTGCLGLGSKSPLAYTDQFNVTSWYQGEKAVYTIYKNEKGLPAINRIFHDKSDEPTGVEVRISIKRHDFHAFRTKAIEVYQWFTPRPNVGGVSSYDWPQDNISFRGDTWALRKVTDQKMTVVMGNVAYHVEKSDLQPIMAKMGRGAQTLCNCGPILYVGIGDVDIAASRETLKFDSPKTLPSIAALLEKMSTEVVAKFQAEIEKSPTHWDARKVFKKLKNTQPLGLVLPDKATWKGLLLTTEVKLNEYDGYTLKKKLARAKKYFLKRNRRTGVWSVSTYQSDEIACEANAQLFVIDGKNHISRVGYAVRQSLKTATGESNVAYVISEAEKIEDIVHSDGTVTVSDVEIYDLKRFLKEAHLDNVVRKTSELPDPPRGAVGTRASSHAVLKPLMEPPKGRTSNWAENAVDFDAGGVYVEVKGNFWSAGTMRERKAESLFNLTAIIPTDEIVGVRHNHWKEFEDAENWVRLDQYIIDKYKDNIAAKEAAVRADVWRRVCDSYQMNLWSELLDFGPAHKDGLFAKLCKTFEDLNRESESQLARAYKTALPFLGTPLNSDKPFGEIMRLYRSFELRYPMLTQVKDWRDKKAINHYVGLVDGIRLHTKKPTKKKRKYSLPELQTV